MRSHAKNKAAGFAIVEALLVIIVLAGIIAAGIYVMRQRQVKPLSNSSTNNSAITQPQAPTGTSSSIDQLTAQDAAAEQGADNQADTQMQQDANSANSATSNVGGAYNEANL